MLAFAPTAPKERPVHVADVLTAVAAAIVVTTFAVPLATAAAQAGARRQPTGR